MNILDLINAFKFIIYEIDRNNKKNWLKFCKRMEKQFPNDVKNGNEWWKHEHDEFPL